MPVSMTKQKMLSLNRFNPLVSSLWSTTRAPAVGVMTGREVMVTVLFFAGARDLAGVDRSALTLTAVTTPEQLLAQVVRSFGEIDKIKESVIVSLNQEYCEPGQDLVLATGDEVAIIPPISGGIMDHIKLTLDILSVEQVTTLVTDPSCGAISLFVGTTRDTFQGKNVVRLEYESYQEMAEKEMYKLCKEAREKWSLKHIAIHHRLGLVPVTESSVIVAVSSKHRRECLDAVSFLIDSLKANVPIWKKEVYSDGSGDWKKNKECTWVKKEDIPNKSGSLKETVNNNKRIDEDGSREASQPLAKRIKQEKDPEAKDEMPLNTVGKSCTHASNENSEGQQKKLFVQETNDQHELDPNLVQIVASKKELDRRIAAFQQRKREELDVLNVQEFCTLGGGTSSLNSCARTSAVILRSKGSNSHLKMTHIVNDWGPQTLGLDPGSLSPNFDASKEAIKQERKCDNSNNSSRESSVSSGHSSKETLRDSKFKPTYEDTQDEDVIPPGIEERLHNLESHLRLAHGAPVPRDVYARIKAVEDRVLHLEGISPEYFRHKKIQAPANTSRKVEIKAVEDDLSLEELELKIHQIKMKIKQKQLNHVL